MLQMTLKEQCKRVVVVKSRRDTDSRGHLCGSFDGIIGLYNYVIFGIAVHLRFAFAICEISGLNFICGGLCFLSLFI